MAVSKSTAILALFVMLCLLGALVESANPTGKAPKKKAAFRGYYSWDESRAAVPDARPSEDVVVAEYIDSCMREPGCQWHCGAGREDCDCVCKVVDKSVSSSSSSSRSSRLK